MNKNSILTAAAMIGLLAAPLAAFANKGGYFSTQHPLPQNQLAAEKKNLKQAPTQIRVNNYTNNRIFVEVPAGGFEDEIFPNGFDDIKNYRGSFFTQLIIKGPNHRPINGQDGQTYCPFARINVYGYSINEIYVDNSGC